MATPDHDGSNLLDLTARRVLVTGASSGIGRATAILLSRLGAELVLVGRDEARMEETRAALAGDNQRVELLDLVETPDLGPWLAGLAKAGGPFSGVVHCAGIQEPRPLKIVSPETVSRTLDINVGVALALARATARRGVAADGASLVLLASVMGLVGQPGQTVYGASKGAIVALTKSLAVELAPRLRVNCVAPGLVETPMAERLRSSLGPAFEAVEAAHPLGLGRPEDVAGAVAFLVADTGRWITGTTLVVDGGYTAH